MDVNWATIFGAAMVGIGSYLVGRMNGLVEGYDIGRFDADLQHKRLAEADRLIAQALDEHREEG
jgi:hypothetical protein